MPSYLEPRSPGQIARAISLVLDHLAEEAGDAELRYLAAAIEVAAAIARDAARAEPLH